MFIHCHKHNINILCTFNFRSCTPTPQKMNFSVKTFFGKSEQIPSFLRIFLHLLKKFFTLSCHWSISIPPETSENLWISGGLEREPWNEMG